MSNSTHCFVAGLLLAATASVFAQECPDGTTRLSRGQINSQIIGNTMCATSGGDRWQEYHASSGDLIDYKKGPADPVDPSEKVGTWVINGAVANTVLVHRYDSQSFSWAVCAVPAGGYTLISSSGVTIPNVSVRAGQGGC
ncbi:hypothetical protein [Rubrivivax gelatinosus]|uniref:hypothetical protein n=1 Tax=Rubrivivax gelatinosus TaxID=28068 RepID=UPI0005C1C5C6|nr:hypothetical protein [Rubrivivax gelatinosus]MBG6080408.1 hypothetical protein [Rubrivivax gelatinosus]